MEKLGFNNYKDCIDFLHKNKKGSEYKLKDGICSPHNSLLLEQGLVEEHLFNENNQEHRFIVNDFTVQRFHPNNIDQKEFWSYAKTKFPKFSICGSPVKTIQDCNTTNLGLATGSNFINYIKQIVDGTKHHINFFEIGYGYGNIFFYLKYHYPDRINYKGIDFQKLKKHNKYKELMVIDKSGIPDSIANNSQHIVYSVNVLQHCSQKDRFQYFEEAYQKLVPGGYFFGMCFIYSDATKDLPVWGIQDKNGRMYCNFFNQLTEVDTHEELVNKLLVKLGFIEVTCGLSNNIFYFILRKPL